MYALFIKHFDHICACYGHYICHHGRIVLRVSNIDFLLESMFIKVLIIERQTLLSLFVDLSLLFMIICAICMYIIYLYS